MKLLKKIFFGILLASALFAIVYFLPNIYDIGIDPIKMYQDYTNYVIFLYISIILVYIGFTTHARLSATIVVAIFLVNFFWLASFFTQGTLGINTTEFYILTILFVLALAVTYIRYRIRFPLIVLIGIPFVIILLNHALPLYPSKPDFQGFYDAQITTLYVQSADKEKTLQEAETKITVSSDNKEKIIPIGKTFEHIELSTSGTQIIFSSKTGIQNTYAYIAFPKGAILELFPQSAIAIQEKEVHIIQGKVNIYTPQEQSGYLTLSGDLSKVILNDTGRIQNLIDKFMAQRNAYFINQIGGDIMLNPTIDRFIGRYLGVANSASKIAQNVCTYTSLYLSNLCAFTSFDQNILNYNEFHTYLDYKTQNSYEVFTGSAQRIARDTQKGWNATNTKGRRDKIQNTINNIFK